MRKILAVIVLASCGAAVAQTEQDLLTDGKNTENVTTFGQGYDLKMYSPLKQINKSNIKRLVPVWTFSLSNDMGELSQPTVYRLMESGELPYVRFGRCRRVKKSDVLALIERKTIAR